MYEYFYIALNRFFLYHIILNTALHYFHVPVTGLKLQCRKFWPSRSLKPASKTPQDAWESS